MSDDRLAIELAVTRALCESSFTYDDWHELGRRTRRLVHALDAVLKLHQPEPVKWTEVCSAHLSFTTTTAEEEACPDCSVIAYTACTRCRNPDDEPARFEDCEVRAAITREVTA